MSAARISRAWFAYEAALDRAKAEQLQAVWKHAAGPGTCGVPWPPSLDDVEPLPCGLEAGHGAGLPIGHPERTHSAATPWSAAHTLEWT